MRAPDFVKGDCVLIIDWNDEQSIGVCLTIDKQYSSYDETCYYECTFLVDNELITWYYDWDCTMQTVATFDETV